MTKVLDPAEPDPSRTSSHSKPRDIPIPPGHSRLEIGLAILDRLVKDHQAVVTAAEVNSDGTGRYTVRIPRAPRA
jgi:hypothetical protein